MEFGGRVVLVTGGANGIGRALCQRIAQERPRGIIIADCDLPAAISVAEELGARAMQCDVSCEADVKAVVEKARQEFGQIEIVVSNAGVTAKGGFEAPDEDWDRLWRINSMAHVYLARATVPDMVERGGGAFIVTASAAGLLTEIGSAAYSVTKHGAVAFAEWLSVHYRNRGLKVACLCPAGVATDFLDMNDPIHQFLHYRSVTPAHVAECVIETLRSERFLVLPHPEVGEFFQFKTQDYDRWLHNFAHINSRLQKRLDRVTKATKDSSEIS
ncbi:SDR family oxidoreductase [Schlesneria paludicola]|uniref:SDR family oxidoreductase n=1 Tax=Schlesneria paludicola TaxID=360056 RepID=UPI00029AB01E|nr:SDR family NAD(P)-dependent oxidoreductase [Schlesneria paludicola]